MQQFEVVYSAVFLLTSNVTQIFNVKLTRYYRTLITKSPTFGRDFTEQYVAKFITLRNTYIIWNNYLERKIHTMDILNRVI